MRNGVIFSVAIALAIGAAAVPASAEEFEKAQIVLQQNFTDKDVEVVIFVKAQDHGLVEMTITGPAGRSIVKFTSSEPGSIGGREFLIESPEPEDTSQVLSAFPEGTYQFHGLDTEGTALTGTAVLSHVLPSPTEIIEPANGAALSRSGAVRWHPVAGATKYFIEIKNDDQELKIEVEVPSSTTSIAVPTDWLTAGMEYELGLGVVNQFGNLTVVELHFRAE